MEASGSDAGGGEVDNGNGGDGDGDGDKKDDTDADDDEDEDDADVGDFTVVIGDCDREEGVAIRGAARMYCIEGCCVGSTKDSVAS